MTMFLFASWNILVDITVCNYVELGDLMVEKSYLTVGVGVGVHDET